MLTFRISPASSCELKSRKVGLLASSLGLISRWAKKASTTTIRIGNAALLKKRLMGRLSVAVGTCAKCRWTKGRRAPASGVQDRHVGQVPVPLGVVEPVPDDEAVGDLEPHVAGAELHPAALGLREQRAHLERAGSARAEVAQQVLQRQARVDDVLDDEDVATLDRGVEVLEDADDPRGLRRRAIGGDGHEVDLARDVERPHEIRQEEDGALEHADEERLAALVVLRDLSAQLSDATGQLVGLDQDLADGGVTHPSGFY